MSIALTDVSPVSATFLCINVQVSIGVSPVFTETRVYNRAMFVLSPYKTLLNTVSRITGYI